MSLLLLSLLATSTACLACMVLLIIQARVYYQREDRWRKRDEELRDQLWVLAGGKKPVVRYEREQVVKVADPDAVVAPMTAWDQSVMNDAIKEEVEQIHRDAAGMSVAQIQAKYPQMWAQAEAMLREEQRPIRG